MGDNDRASVATRPWARTLEVVALAVPVVAYFWFIGTYAVNVIYYDSWSDIFLIANESSLWAQHNENRLLFPNILVLLQSDTTHFNIVFEEFLSGAMLVAATGLFIGAHKRRSPSTPWLYYFPVLLVMLSFVQAGNTLWGFQLAWYLVMLALAATIFIIDRPTLTRMELLAAIVVAVVGSLSSLQGLLIWPVGLVLLWHRRRTRGFLYAWSASAVITGALYFSGFDFAASHSNTSYLLSNPIAGLRTFFFVIGDVFGGKIADNNGDFIPNAPQASIGLVIALGIVLFAIALWVMVVYGLRRDDVSGRPVGAAMVIFGILYVLTIVVGRASPSSTSGGASRYTTFTLLIIAGCYLSLLSRPRARTTPSERGQPDLTTKSTYLIVRWTLLAAVCLLVVLGSLVGIDFGRYWHQREEVMADVTVNLDKVSNHTLDTYVFPGGAQYVRSGAQIAAKRHLSLFATGAVSHYSKEGLFKELTAVQVRVVKPSANATLSGTQDFYAAASSPIGLTKVQFRLTGGALHGVTIATGGPLFYGWVARWNSKSVANGRYSLQCVAYAYNGKVTDSPGVVVTVKNPG
jgi:hypothetical protein